MDMTREDMYSLVSSTMDQALRDIHDLENSISNWTAEEQAMSVDHYDGSTLGPVTLQKVDEYLEGFFAKKRGSAEPGGRIQVDEDVKQQIQSSSVQTSDLSSSTLFFYIM
ncbi:unnamed protein product [Pleuronectes platessa]|uniref:Uncharacterized protein n=1 Tax=Pleuronectes platessa TaxID=8262 RepID=A0A9N7V0Q4_PLEPL|nr:unnamed protein product [Pleuronectes platessa]